MKELKEDDDYYMNGDGLIVLTKKFHLDRGYCCGCGCIHCPYGYENVPDPKKSRLLNEENRKAEER